MLNVKDRPFAVSVVAIAAGALAINAVTQIDWITQVKNKPFVDIRTYNFAAQTPGGSLTGSSPATVSLVPCPSGVAGTDLYHYLYVSGGTGTAEAVLITGGTCTSGAASGTVTFTPANSHSGSWTIQSATSGIQECVLSGTKMACLVPSGLWPIYGTLALGNGDANQTLFTVQSTYQGFRVYGEGAARDFTTPYGTKLQWQGASGGTMVIYHGPVSQVELAFMALDGNGIAGNIVQSAYGDQGYIHDMLIGNSKAGTYFGFRCDFGCGSNVFENVHIVQTNSGTSDMAMGYQPVSQGVSQNNLHHVYGQFPADTATSYGLVMQAADNNKISECDFQGTILTVTNATNATPIVITSSAAIPGIASGQKVTILGVVGNTAANNTAASQQWTITAIDTTHFSLNGSTGNGAYVSGGSISGPGYALALITNGNEPIENTFLGGAYFNALSYDDDAGHGTNQFFGVSTGDGFLIPPSTSSAGLIHPDYYVTADSGGGYSRLIGRLKFVDTNQVLGYAKFYPATRVVAIGDGLESYAAPADLTIVRAAHDAALNIFTTGASGSANLNFQTPNGHLYTVSSDQVNNYFKIATAAGNAIRVVSTSTAVGISTPVAFASLGSVLPAGFSIYCTDCITAAVCAGAGTGHMAVSNGTNWTCQ